MAEREDRDDDVSENGKLSGAKESASEAGESQTTETQTDADDEYGISMDKIEAVLNQKVDTKHMTPQMRRLVQRQEENTKRVEETIKGTRANPRWFVPLFITLMILGLIWIVVYYLAATMGHTSFPIPHIGQWNLLVGFGILLVGFLMTMWWR
ncbi:cell division protein CrgA [Bombiscardovia coagulans]|uniref:Cell division protein CrgA n=1 Tax=Bombiscardovia coagulans TaxID=686666 RepID=A0A261EQD4_9BIFI|nr:cell division protein CrgA [Bombiscardovia coagulans]OZG49070.1 septation inhibitor protein [Bombiscardovia coagulans]